MFKTQDLATQTDDFELQDRRKSLRSSGNDILTPERSNPEEIFRLANKPETTESELALQMKMVEQNRLAESWKNPTPMMLAQNERMVARQKMTRKEQIAFSEDMHAANKIIFETIFPPY